MEIGNRVKWRNSMATIIDVDGDRLYIHLECNVVKWVSVGEIKTYKKK